MFRPAMLTAAALALGALGAAAEWSATGTRSGAALMPVAPRHWRNQGECAAGPVVPVGRRWGSHDQDCAEAAPVVPVGRTIPNRDECTAGPVMPVGFRHP